jgi:hypothetical protein
MITVVTEYGVRLVDVTVVKSLQSKGLVKLVDGKWSATDAGYDLFR